MIDRPNKIHQLTLSKKTRIGLLRKSLLSVDSISLVSPFATETPLHTCCAQSFAHANSLCAQQTCRLRFGRWPICGRRSVSLILKMLVSAEEIRCGKRQSLNNCSSLIKVFWCFFLFYLIFVVYCLKRRKLLCYHRRNLFVCVSRIAKPSGRKGEFDTAAIAVLSTVLNLH